MIARRIGLELAKARRAAGLTQAEVAARAETTQSAIARAEAGRVTPSSDLIDKIARAIDAPITIVFGPVQRKDRRRRVKQALGGYRFDPWERDPSPVEQRALKAAGLTRERTSRS